MKRNGTFALAPAVGVAFVLLYAVSASPGHGYVSVPAAAFQPVDEGYEYWNPGYGIINQNDDSDDYVAPVYLPQGATVTKVSLYYNDNDCISNGSLELNRTDLAANVLPMASVGTLACPGSPSARHDSSVDYAVIDNSQYAYFLSLDIPTSLIPAYGAIIEYTYPTGLPLVLRNFQEAVRGR